jgi:class 3 adenylate cyclase
MKSHQNLKTCAVMFTDMVGSAPRVSKQSPEQNEAMSKLHSDLIVPLVEEYRGEVRNKTGDGFLIIFRTSTEAITAAEALQNKLRSYNQANPGTAIIVRIGIHTGDISFNEEELLLSNVVNIAKRIEGKAKPGGVCFSKATQEAMQIPNLNYRSIGKRKLKGLDELFELFELRLFETEEEVSLQKPQKSTKLATRKKHDKEQLNVANSILAEIEGLIEICRYRQYKEHFAGWIKYFEAGGGNERPTGFDIRQDYFKAHKANAGRLGLLSPPLPSLIAKFYTQAMSITEDIKSMTQGRFKTFTNEQSLKSMSELYTLFDSTEKLGIEICNQIKTEYQNPVPKSQKKVLKSPFIELRCVADKPPSSDGTFEINVNIINYGDAVVINPIIEYSTNPPITKQDRTLPQGHYGNCTREVISLTDTELKRQFIEIPTCCRYSTHDGRSFCEKGLLKLDFSKLQPGKIHPEATYHRFAI